MDEVTAKTFDIKVFKSKTPVLVYFTGKYCYPCKRIEPILNDLSEEIGDKMKFVKYMINENTFKFAKRFNLNAVPTLLIFKGGVMIHSLVGFVPKPVLRTFLEESIKL
jgi:thioredoxin 1